MIKVFILIFILSAKSVFAISGLNESECRADFIASPGLKKVNKFGLNAVTGKVSKFNPCNENVFYNDSSNETAPLFILLHGGSGAKDVSEINKALLKLGVSTLVFDAYKMNGFKQTPFIGNFHRQRMILPIAVGAYKWARKQSKFKFSGIYIYGFSNGATVAVNLAGKINSKKLKGIVVEGTSNSGAGLGLPNEIKNRLLMIYGELDNLSSPINKRRWNSASKCRVNGVLKYSGIPKGTAQNCNNTKNGNESSITIQNWAKQVKLIDGGTLNFKYIKGGAHGIMTGKLEVMTRADFMKKIGRKALVFMKKTGWNSGGDINAKKTLIDVISTFAKLK